ncbi:Nif11-like leader peptide family natural product precursor [Dolichospermum sp. UHCC 0259]|uniref:Nif11-like leader peptide family natural product precursor n=1 Tax=Dolichospermum sp. UHCC 0259 TaxID=2590010 RepID=UPI00144858D9|nr:Nif11-like leader peptide family natural product precursor [Dolichospermum sp. UHCC 0259]MTJ47578.1 Nif11-like leader peptide family natural product precursor [Dolichospermum sp. UHCC 0259]
MSLGSVRDFYKQLVADDDFRNQIQNVENKEECSQIVKAAGYDFTQEEYEEYTLKLLESVNSDNELQDLGEKELAGVFGGITGWPKIQPLYGVIRPPMQLLYGVIIDNTLI